MQALITGVALVTMFNWQYIYIFGLKGFTKSTQLNKSKFIDLVSFRTSQNDAAFNKLS